MADRFPSVKARRLLSILMARPLEYVIVRQQGSHRRLESNNYPPLTFSFHNGATIPGGQVRTILVKDAGLDEDAARGLL
ncbi:MAG TPA: type II toxin-antitoxin system HicA family toxin [Solirubrobacteraceae bacterium]